MQEITKILENLITFLFQVGVYGAAIILIILGIRYAVEARSQKTELLRKFLIYVILGLVLLFIASFVPQLLRSFFEQFSKGK